MIVILLSFQHLTAVGSVSVFLGCGSNYWFVTEKT